MVESKYIRYKGSQLHYIKAGNGNKTLLFFHGFGQDHSVYLPAVQSLANYYTVFVFDLYFHGKSHWAHDELALEKEQWKETMELFFTENNVEKFSLAGYSLGGKFALATLEAFPSKCRKIFLIAPDGIKTSLWYSLATYPHPARNIFKSFIHNYPRFTAIANFLSKLNLVDKGLVRFADYQMNTEAKRRRVYYSWVVFRHLKFSHELLVKLLKQYKIETVIIVGRYDKVIKPENIEPFTRQLDNFRFEVLEAGHSGLLTQEVLSKHLLPHQNAK